MPKPYTAVTVAVETQTGESFAVDDFSCIPNLVELVSLQQSGPEEAARAIRKKLKYGNVHRQLRALVILDGLIQNAGPRFQRTFANEPLLERLRVCATSPHSDPEVRKKCDELFRGWVQYKNIAGMSGIASLVNQLPRRKVVVTRDVSKAVRETENPFDDDEDTDAETSKPGQAAGSAHRPSASTEWPAGSSPSASASASTSSTGHQSFGHAKSSSGFWSSRKKDKEKEKEKRKSSKDKLRAPINLQTERPRIKATIADSSLAATNLLNSMQVVNRETERISENQVCVQRFEECKTLRRQVLRYIHNIHSEEFLGGLLHANDELINALITFEQLDRSINADSDSDDDLAAQAHMYRMAQLRTNETGNSTSGATSSPSPDMAGLSLENSTTPSSPPSTSAPSSRRGSRAPPPRPPAASKPSRNTGMAQNTQQQQQKQPLASVMALRKPEQLEDENDPFADSNVIN
ncbi:Protein lsb5 [Ceratocystis fimbriata CBS 114723]|uniref:Protein lsb5 n=1 Tax=Ceratocystis fimbriata CBS 114723 TaxID=1035309 RepID=A0A2C5X114_9PEZI|nr:Protein lsb5 [Ceratocystis fimbriata CBS 114723]